MDSLRETLVKIKHNSKFLTRLWYICRQPKFIALEKRKQKAAQKRAQGFQDPRYQSIMTFRGIHAGERCFIVATGPSLTIADLETLKSEYTFGMNSITKLYSQTSWRPTYYGIQDSNVYEKMEQSIRDTYQDAQNVFVSDTIADRFSVPDSFHQFPHDAVYHDNQLEIDRYFARFSDDCYTIVYDGYSITYSLIQIAAYMGFREIYLLGVDCSYKRGGRNHIVDSGNDDKNEEKNYDKMTVGYQKAKEYADTHGIKIINCTRGGMLEVFPRAVLEDVLKEERKGENGCNRTNEAQ